MIQLQYVLNTPRNNPIVLISRYTHQSQQNINSIPQPNSSYVKGLTSSNIGLKTPSRPNRSIVSYDLSYPSGYEPYKTTNHMLINDDKDGKATD